MQNLENLNKDGQGSDQKISPQFHAVISIIFLLISVFLILLFVDSYSTSIKLNGKTNITTGWIIDKQKYRSKTGYRYHFKYDYEIDSVTYHRKQFFGLFNRDTTVTAHEFDKFDIGSDVKVVYSTTSPNISKLQDLGFDRNYSMWQILGAFLFGFIGINELRNLFRRK